MKCLRGFTLIEISVALAILAIVLTASASYIQHLRANDAQQWDEFCAHELAVSVLQEIRASPPEVGESDFKLAGPASEKLSTTLPDAKIRVHVTPAGEKAELLEARVVVTWAPSLGRGSERRAELERRAIVRGPSR